MRWREFYCEGETYNLEHLHPFSFDMVIPAKQGQPEQRYNINVRFSLHCFSRGVKPGEKIPDHLAYSDDRETRIFDLDRYNRSKTLPEIVRSLGERKCFHDSHGNFYVFEVTEEDGTTAYYSVFFTLSKAGKKAGLNLFISSAHLREERPYVRQIKPIRFRVLVYNTWKGRAVKPAP